MAVEIRSELGFGIAVAATVAAFETVAGTAAADEAVDAREADESIDEKADEEHGAVDEATDAVVGEVDATLGEALDGQDIRKEQELMERNFHLAT